MLYEHFYKQYELRYITIFHAFLRLSNFKRSLILKYGVKAGEETDVKSKRIKTISAVSNWLRMQSYKQKVFLHLFHHF